MADPADPDRKDGDKPDPAAAAPVSARRALIASTAALVAGALTKAEKTQAASGDPVLVDANHIGFGGTGLLRVNGSPGSPIVPALEVNAAGGGTAFYAAAGPSTSVPRPILTDGPAIAALKYDGTSLVGVSARSGVSLPMGSLVSAAEQLDAGLALLNTRGGPGAVAIVQPSPNVVAVTATALASPMGFHGVVGTPPGELPLGTAAGVFGVHTVVGRWSSQPDLPSIGAQVSLGVTDDFPELPLQPTVGVRAVVGTFGRNMPTVTLTSQSVAIQALVGTYPEPTLPVAGVEAILGNLSAAPLSVTVTAQSAAVRGVALDPLAVGGVFVGPEGGRGLEVYGDAFVHGNLHVTGSGGGSGIRVVCGSALIPGGQLHFDVFDPNVEAESFVSVQVTSDPGRARIRFTESFHGGFRLHFLRRSPATGFAIRYVVIDC
jgi:hypothetical protein